MSAPSRLARAVPEPPGRYELRAEIARGGMGVVLHAYDRLAQREIAYKRLHAGNGAVHARIATLFEREYNTLARLSHPNIVQVYEYGIDAQGPYYTMELLSGGDLLGVAPMPLRAACSVLRDVASALALVHARRLIHRDISPVNVRLSPDKRAKLIDFGALTGFGPAAEIVGTHAFIAPECLTREPLDARTDLYSLGTLAYWVLTGKTAFDARSLAQRAANLDAPIAPPSAHVAELPGEIDELVLSLLRRDPIARPGSAAEVMQRLSTIADLPVEDNVKRVAYSYLTHPPLVGRDDELAVARRLLDEVVSGQRRTLVIESAPRLGRSALLDQIAIDAQLRGAVVMRAQGMLQPRRFALAHALLRTTFGTRPPQQDGSVRAVLPGEAESGPAATPVEASAQHARQLNGLQVEFLELCRQHPLVLLIDDAHLADAESLAVLASLSQLGGDHPLFFVLALGGKSSQDHASPLRMLGRDATRLRLHALDPEHTHELVSSIFGAVPNARRVALWLHELCAGRPGAAMDRLHQLISRGLIQYHAGTFSLPHDPGDATEADDAQDELARIRELSDHARTIARVLSLQHVALSLEQVVAAVALPGRDVLPAIEELIARGIVRNDQAEVALVGDRARRAIQDTLDAPSRKALHLAVARALMAGRDGSSAADYLIGANLIGGGEESAGVALIAQAFRQHRHIANMMGGLVPLLEAVLDVMRRQGRSDAECLPVLVPLVQSSYFGDYGIQERHLERTLTALSNVCGMTLATKLRRFIGTKAAMYVGMLLAAIRLAFTPRAQRLGTFRDTLVALLSLTSAGVAAAVSAFEPRKAFEIIDRIRPLEAFRKGTAPHLAYHFSLASAYSGAGRYRRAAELYTELRAILERGPVPGLDPASQAIYNDACLYGQAQAEVSRSSALALELADLLKRGNPFYAPHAESARMAYFGMRGEQELADRCRDAAELAALRGGTSWSAVTILTVRATYAYIWTQNATGLVQTIPELERMAKTTPGLIAFRDVARAYLSLLRGHASKAVELFEKTFELPGHAELPTAWLDRTFYAEALCAAGRYLDARTVCLEVLANEEALDTHCRRHLPLQALALAEAGLGNVEAAAQRLDACLASLTIDNPLVWGSLHRDRATVALIARDEPKMREHLQAMSACFRQTNNPWLVRQVEQLTLRAQVENLGAGLHVPATGLDATAIAALSSGVRSGIVKPSSAAVTRVLPNDEEGGEPRLTTIILSDEAER